jgi:hypothetical protein
LAFKEMKVVFSDLVNLLGCKSEGRGWEGVGKEWSMGYEIKGNIGGDMNSTQKKSWKNIHECQFVRVDGSL